MMELIIFVFGLIVGSFLNVVIARYNSGLSIFYGRSQCFSCGKTLGAKELIPVLSFVFQKGKCADCGSKISWRYPAVEILTALVFVLLFLKIFPIFFIEWIYFLLFTILFSLLIVIGGYDLKHKIIPNSFSYAFAGLGLFSHIFFLLFPSFFSHSSLLLTTSFLLKTSSLWYFLSGPILALFFFTLWLITRGRGIGLGDAKLALGIGWLLGLSSGASAILLAFWIGAVVGILIILYQKISSRYRLQATHYTLKSEIPFGPFLILATWLVFFLNINFVTITGWLSFGI